MVSSWVGELTVRSNGLTLSPLATQIPWSDEYVHEAARELFGANLLTLTWVKGEPMARGLIDEILRGLGLERETEQKSMQRRKSTFQALPGLNRSNSTESRGLRRGSSGQW